MDIFIDLLTSIILAYCLLGAIYTLRLSWDSITARFSGLVAILCVWAFWPVVMWAEAGHVVRERDRARRAVEVNTQEYLAAVARLSAEWGGAPCQLK